MERVREHMTKFPIITDPKTPVEKAFDIMIQAKIRHLPVIINDKVEGVVSDRDLRLIIGQKTGHNITIGDVMTEDPYSVVVGTALVEVVRTMALEKIGCAIIVDLEHKPMGIFTTTDALHLLARLLEDEPEGRYHSDPIEKHGYSFEMVA